MRCKYLDSNGDQQVATVTWRLFYPACGRLNQRCNALLGAYVPAVTVCLQRLFATT